MVNSRHYEGSGETHHAIGVVDMSVSALDPESTVHTQGEDWTARAQGGKHVDNDQQVAVEGLLLTVKHKSQSKQQPNRQASAQDGSDAEKKTDN